MSDAQDYLLAIDKDKQVAAQIAGDTAKKLQAKQVTLIDVVQSLGEYINDDDSNIRGKAVSYLTAVLSSLPPKYLSRQHIQVLCQFFCDRIQDGGAIEGLTRLQQLDRFIPEMAQVTARALLEQFQDLQVRPQTSRFQILQLLNDLMSNHRKAIRDLADESLVGVIDLVSGEKDPRNLMLVFSMLKVIMIEWDISQHGGILFDAVFAYFPITFRPPPDDPYGITAQDLKDRLQDCIASTRYLAPHAIPALIDKLDSTSPNVKKDSLRALKACAITYSPDVLGQYSITLWDSLKFEILSAQEEDLSEEALAVLQAVAKTLSKVQDPTNHKSVLAQYLRPILKECIEHFEEPLQRQAKAAGQISAAVSSAALAAYTLTVKGLMPALFTIFQAADSLSKQRALFEVAVALIDSGIAVPVTEQNPLEASKNKLIELFSRALMGTIPEEVSFRLTALKGLLRLAQIRALLPDNEIGLIVQYFNDIVLTEESLGMNELKREAIQGLAEISRNKPNLIMDITYPAFMSRLPDNDVGDASQYVTTLEGLAEISVEKEIFETLIRRLLNKLDVLLKSEYTSSARYAEALLSTILFVITRNGLFDDPSVDSYFDRIVVGLTRRAVLPTAPNANNQRTALNHEVVLDVLGRICCLIVHNSSKEKQAEVSKQIYDLFSFSQGYRDVLGAKSSPGRRETLIISTWLLAGVPRDLTASPYTCEELTNLFKDLVASIMVEDCASPRLALLRQLSLYANKFLPKTHISVAKNVLDDLYKSISGATQLNLACEGDTREELIMQNRIKAVFWLSKGLILRLAPTTNDIIANLVSLMSNIYTHEVGRNAAYGFGMILEPDDVLSASNGAQIRLLAKQRVFNTLAPLIAEKFRLSTEANSKNNYLTALSGILSSVPSAIVMPELPTLLPLLLQSLDLADNTVKEATLETITVVLKENAAAIEASGHVPSLIRRLLKAAALEKTSKSTPRARALGIRCLSLFPGNVGKAVANASPLLALKKEVLRGLGKALDDPKREVRKEAVDARGAWLRGVDDVADDSD